MKQPGRLLAIVELGGYPNFGTLYSDAGFEVRSAPSLRKGLMEMRAFKPHVVVSEFRYGPTYGSQLSNLESLMAAMQRHCPDGRLIVFHEPEDSPHLKRLEGRFPVHAALPFPISVEALQRALLHH